MHKAFVGQQRRINGWLLAALAAATAYHGAILFFTFKRTFDAYVHIFFADHYRRSWFDLWEYRWYTGFPIISYPPGSHQSIALLSKVIGLQNGFILVMLFSILLVTLGVYRFSKIWVSEEAAGYAAMLAVFSSSIAEVAHVFGQLPTLFSLGFLLNGLPYAYQWISGEKSGRSQAVTIFTAWLLSAAATAGHHVTTLFGAVFFLGPVILLALVEKFRFPSPGEPSNHPESITQRNLRPLVIRRFRRVAPSLLRTLVYGAGMVTLLILVVLPYWLWSRSDPITQVPIPHASRDSYIANPIAGFVFFIVPYGVTLFILPYIAYKGLVSKAWPLFLSILMLFLLGTGGTTPIPRLLLQGAFEILTLDRFTFWATILSLPLAGEFVVSLRRRGLAIYIREQFGQSMLYITQASLAVSYIVFCVFTTNFSQWRRIQPEPIDMQPIVNFLEKDEHWRWRYLTLGFGDQMAWLSAQTNATTVDGNYHSARRLPELITTPVERLEGAKFRGIPGIGSLQQFLAVPEKYNLKFIFSNDAFYDPLLYFSGWHRIQRLENGIMVWEREDIPPLPEVLPRRNYPFWQSVMWGILPMSAILLALITFSKSFWLPAILQTSQFMGLSKIVTLLNRVLGPPVNRFLRFGERLYTAMDRRLLAWSQFPEQDDSPVSRWQFWLDWISRIPRPTPAPPQVQHLRSLIVIGLITIFFGFVGFSIRLLARNPVSIVENYYDALDFRRFKDAYVYLDPLTRSNFDQYLLELSVTNGLAQSFGKLDSITVQVLLQEPQRIEAQADLTFVTSLASYQQSEYLTLVKREDSRWYIQPSSPDVRIPPDQFYRRPGIDWFTQGRRRVTEQETEFSDVLDRPELQLLSARLVEQNERKYVVGEIVNTDVDPADLTVTAILSGSEGFELSRYNVQTAILHKLFPKESTPFRVDFEGVAGATVNDLQTAGDFSPDAYSPLELEKSIIKDFQVYAKAVVTGYDLERNLSTQDLAIHADKDGSIRLSGMLINIGTIEATIPHILVAYYGQDDRVLWVDQFFIENSIRPQRQEQFDIPLTNCQNVTTIIATGGMYSNILVSDVPIRSDEQNSLPNPFDNTCPSIRVAVNFFYQTK